MRNKRRTTDAVKILHSRYIKGNAKRAASVRGEREKAHIAMQIHRLRTKAGLSQKQLAGLVGTTQSVISRLESTEYSGHSMNMLEKIASALNCAVRVDLVPEKKQYAYA
jgi:ribosome-binding protein aMBF1 (putative translation factor)